MSIKVVGIIGVLAFTLGIGSGFILDSDTEATVGALTVSTTPTVVHEKKQMSPTMIDAIEELRAKRGESQDIAFLEDMVVQHEWAIGMAGVVVNGTRRPEIKKIAEDIIRTQTSEITLMKEWLNKWYGR